ncbi:MAG: DUF5103 domain-containing protein [Muribaculaceae bacterium]|nr:DUF5103 domain-containing protein [Muribaculaceae bacterium]
MVKSRLYITFISLLTCLLISAAHVDTMTGMFSDKVRTLRLMTNGNPQNIPVIFQGTADRIEISFDILSDSRDYLRYRLIHCNAYWQPDGLVDSEFLDGFNEGTIEDYDFSRATTVHYVHYRLELPNAETVPLISGNYLVQVYDETDPDNVLLQARFMVCENNASISAAVSSRTDVDYNDAHQQLSIAVDTERAPVRDPFNDLIVLVQQNGRLDSEVALRHPLRTQGSQVIYEHLPALIFPAGNQYRRMETVSVRYLPMGIENIEYQAPYYHFDVAQDGPRAASQYLYDSDQHGAFLIREYDSSDSDLEADYVVVHFKLDYLAAPDDMIFLDGDFTSRRFDSGSRMIYNPGTGLWEKALLLKQGAYNYQYLVVPSGGRWGLTAPVEGDHYQTANRYTIKVYSRNPAERYDRLIGISVIESGI